jgi:hypothetical protein
MNVSEQKWAFEPCIQKAERADEIRIGAKVRGEREAAIRCARSDRGKICENIRSAKAVDGLLRIADQQEPGARGGCTGAINRLEDRVLRRVGVLEFVDQRERKSTADRLTELHGIRPIQGSVQLLEQIIEADHAERGFAPRQLRQNVPEQALPKGRDDPCGRRRFELAWLERSGSDQRDARISADQVDQRAACARRQLVLGQQLHERARGRGDLPRPKVQDHLVF